MFKPSSDGGASASASEGAHDIAGTSPSWRCGGFATRCDAMRCDAMGRVVVVEGSRAGFARRESGRRIYVARRARTRTRRGRVAALERARFRRGARARRDSRHPRGVTLDASRDVRASGSARDETMRGRRDETHARFGD